MKKKKKKVTIVTIILAVIIAILVLFLSGLIKDLISRIPKFTYELSGDSYTLTKFSGNTANVVIPETYNELPVTAIGDNAFKYCKRLKSVTIPDSVTSIGDYAFIQCESLTSITIPDSVTSIGEEAFCYCKSLTSVTIGDGVTSIGKLAFYECTSLESITISENNSTYSSQDGIFCNKDKTEIIMVPQAKNEVSIPNSITSIRKNAFLACKRLKSVTIPDSVTSICDSAFSSCTSLESIIIGNGVTSIDDSAFSSCTSLESITVNEYNSAYSSQDGILYNKDKTTLIKVPEAKTSVTIPDCVTSIGSSAFSRCTGLTSIIIPNSVTSIGYEAFRGCTNLKSVTIGNGVTSIGDRTFQNCTSLTSITIPNSVTSIGENTFYNTAYYNNANNWINNVLYIDNHLIEAKDTLSGNYEIKQGTRTIADYAFYNCTNLTGITIPDSVTSIGDYEFNHIGLKGVYITDIKAWCKINFGYSSSNPLFYAGGNLYLNNNLVTEITADMLQGVTEINHSAFIYCTNLTSITIPDSVTSIGSGAFWNCTNLENVTIPNSVTSIGGSAFEDCTSLISITIPDSVTSIGDAAFYECTSLENVTFENTSGWKVSRYSSMSGAQSVNVTDAAQNAEYLTYTYYNCYWHRYDN